MAYSELVILYSLIAILVLLRFYRRPGDESRLSGHRRAGPVRDRRRDPYAPSRS